MGSESKSKPIEFLKTLTAFLKILGVLAILLPNNALWAQGRLCIQLDDSASCDQGILEEKREKAKNAVDKQSVGPGRPGKTGEKGTSPGLGLQTTITDEYSVYTVPLSFPLKGPLGVDISMPFIQTEEASYLGHGRFSLTFGFIPSKAFAVMLYAGLRIQTGDEEYAGAMPVPWPTIAVSLALDVKLYRFFSSLESVSRPKDQYEYDQGDTVSTLVGLDGPFWGSSAWLGYVGWYQSNTEASTSYESSLNDSLKTGDALLGVVYRPLEVRLGVSYAAVTEAQNPDDETRESSVDIGFRYYL